MSLNLWLPSKIWPIIRLTNPHIFKGVSVGLSVLWSYKNCRIQRKVSDATRSVDLSQMITLQSFLLVCKRLWIEPKNKTTEGGDRNADLDEVALVPQPPVLLQTADRRHDMRGRRSDTQQSRSETEGGQIGDFFFYTYVAVFGFSELVSIHQRPRG